MKFPWQASFGVGCFSLLCAAVIQGSAPSWLVWLNLGFWILNWIIAYFKWREQNGH